MYLSPKANNGHLEAEGGDIRQCRELVRGSKGIQNGRQTGIEHVIKSEDGDFHEKDLTVLIKITNSLCILDYRYHFLLDVPPTGDIERSVA